MTGFPGEGERDTAILFFLLWLLLCGQVSAGVCLSGAAVSAVLYWFCCKILGYSLHRDLIAARKLGGLLRYLGNLLWEMLKAGFVVMKLIYTRGRDMDPVLVYFDSDLQTEGALATLADSITLTAGTITVETEDGHFCVHALDRSLAEGIEHSDFARRLRALESPEKPDREG